MLLRRLIGRVIAPTSILLIVLLNMAGCAGSDTDHLSAARKRVQPAPCGNTPAVAGVAGVNPEPHQLYLGDWAVVSVCQLKTLLDAADAAQAPITLFVEGMDSGNSPVGVDLESGTLTFVLDRNDENRQLWRPFLYDPLFDPQVSIHVSVGIRGERPLPRAPGANLIIQIRKLFVDWTTWIWLGLLALISVGIILSAVRTDMLRDGSAVDGVKRAYSLGRTQMAWWFFLAVLSFSFIWMVTGDRDTIPPSVLGLMGISAATAVVAAAIPRKDENQEGPRPSAGWWRDLVSDDRGTVALERLQVIVWTIVLSGVFLTSVIWDLTMPDFNTTLLALMGISSGTYLGFSLPNKS
jgi:hypothetical protein